MSCRSRFSTPKKTRHPYWADAGFRHRLSSSPDSRIIDFTQPSQILSNDRLIVMCDFSTLTVAVPFGTYTRFSLRSQNLLPVQGILKPFIHFSHNKIALENCFVNHVFQKFLLHNQNCCVRMKQRKSNINLTVTV